MLRPVLARDRFAAVILEEVFALDRGITGWVVTHAEAQCINDAQLDPRMTLIPGTPAEDESLIIVPLLHRSDVIGTLNVGRMGGVGSHFDAPEFEIVRLFASQASMALVNAEAHRAMSTQAETDALTGLLNRRAFEVHIVALLADPGFAATVHPDARPRWLQGVQRPKGPSGRRRASGQRRARDSRPRSARGTASTAMGGDELGVLLPTRPRLWALASGERIRGAIAALDSGASDQVTVSVGAACSPDDASTGMISWPLRMPRFIERRPRVATASWPPRAPGAWATWGAYPSDRHSEADRHPPRCATVISGWTDSGRRRRGGRQAPRGQGSAVPFTECPRLRPGALDRRLRTAALQRKSWVPGSWHASRGGRVARLASLVCLHLLRDFAG